MDYFSFNEVLKHGISNPISSILINTELAIEKIKKDPQEAIKHLEQIQVTGIYIQNLLKKPKLDKKEKKEFFLETTIKEILILNSNYKKEFIYSYQNNLDKDQTIKGNKILFQELMICLLNNAAESYKYKNETKTILVTSRKTKKELIISITDGGSGMNWLEKNLAFNRAFSMKENHTGKGLYLVKKIISEEFQGEVELISQKDRGTTVKCIFPRN